MSKNDKLIPIKRNLPIKVGDNLLEILNAILNIQDSEEWYLKALQAEEINPDFAIYCLDKVLLFNDFHFKSEFRLAYLYHKEHKSLFVRHWKNAINKRFAIEHFNDWDTFFEEDTLSEKELKNLLHCINNDTYVERNLIKGQIAFFLKKWNHLIELFEGIQELLLKNEVFYLLKGFALMHKGRLDDATISFKLALEMNHFYSPAKVGIEKCKLQQVETKLIDCKQKDSLIKKRNLENIKKLITYDNRFFPTIISLYFPLSNTIIKKYKNYWDWNCLSRNESIPWSQELINNFRDKWNWKLLSDNSCVPWTEKIIEIFDDNWVYYYEYNDGLSNPSGIIINRSIPWSAKLIKNIIAKFEDYKYYYDPRALSISNWLPNVFYNTSLCLSDDLFHIQSEIFKPDNKVIIWRLSASTTTKWNIELINKYKDIWCWHYLSSNPSLPWSDNLIEKYEDYWDWSTLSQNTKIIWNENLINKYIHKIDWYWLCKNSSIKWTSCMIEKYQNEINWGSILSNDNVVWDKELITKYKSYIKYSYLTSCTTLPWNEKIISKINGFWNWHNLSENPSLPWSIELIRMFKDKWHWESLSKNTSIQWSYEMIKEFKDNVIWWSLSLNNSLQLSTDLISYYESYWEWNFLSSNESSLWTEELMLRFFDKWKWSSCMQNMSIYNNLFAHLKESEIEILMDYYINHFK